MRDVFVLDALGGGLERISNRRSDSSAQPAAGPAIDARGETLVFEQFDAEGQRQIQLTDLSASIQIQALTPLAGSDSANREYHHPGLRWDGQVVSLLETASQWDAADGCTQTLLDLVSQQVSREPCPDALIQALPEVRPGFATDGASVFWTQPNGQTLD